MTDWTARIDALAAAEHHTGVDAVARLALAAERLREPHDRFCALGAYVIEQGTVKMSLCTCGKDSDLLRILEGK